MDEPCTAVVRLLTADFNANVDQLARLTTDACHMLHLSKLQVNVDLVDDPRIQELNRDFRDQDRPTDVLSFPQYDWTTPASTEQVVTAPEDPSPEPVLGDIAISLPTAQKNSGNIGQGLDREVCFLLVHGLLHLCGHDHEDQDDEQIMLKEQRQIMAQFDQAQPPAWQHAVASVGGQHG